MISRDFIMNGGDFHDNRLRFSQWQFEILLWTFEIFMMTGRDYHAEMSRFLWWQVDIFIVVVRNFVMNSLNFHDGRPRFLWLFQVDNFGPILERKGSISPSSFDGQLPDNGFRHFCGGFLCGNMRVLLKRESGLEICEETYSNVLLRYGRCISVKMASFCLEQAKQTELCWVNCESIFVL